MTNAQRVDLFLDYLDARFHADEITGDEYMTAYHNHLRAVYGVNGFPVWEVRR